LVASLSRRISERAPMERSRDADRRRESVPAKDTTERRPASAAGVNQVIALQRLAGNAVTISWFNRARGTAQGTARPRGFAAQRDIAAGLPLPDAAVIGEKRIRDRLEEQEGTPRVDAGFGADLLRLASDKGFVDKLVLEYRNKMEPVIRAKHARAHPDDPDQVVQLVEEELDKKVPSDMDVLIVTGNLLAFLADNPRPTAETTREAMEKFRWMPGEPREWLVRNKIGRASCRERVSDIV
jgi:hypothetical protein